MRLKFESLGFLLQTVRVEHELASLNVGLLTNDLQVLVPCQVLCAVVHHELLLLHQLQRLDPGPLQ